MYKFMVMHDIIYLANFLTCIAVDLVCLPAAVTPNIDSIPADCKISWNTSLLHTKMRKTHKPWSVFIPSNRYLK